MLKNVLRRPVAGEWSESHASGEGAGHGLVCLQFDPGYFILDKRHKDLPKFGCLEDCGCQLVEYLRSLGLHVPRSPWADHRQAEPKQAAKKARASADGGSSFLGGRKLFIECNGHNSKGDKVADT